MSSLRLLQLLSPPLQCHPVPVSLRLFTRSHLSCSASSFPISSVSRDLLSQEEGADGALLLRGEVALDETQHQAGLPDPFVPQHNNLLSRDGQKRRSKTRTSHWSAAPLLPHLYTRHASSACVRWVPAYLDTIAFEFTSTDKEEHTPPSGCCWCCCCCSISR